VPLTARVGGCAQGSHGNSAAPAHVLGAVDHEMGQAAAVMEACEGVGSANSLDSHAAHAKVKTDSNGLPPCKRQRAPQCAPGPGSPW
jgi:hypothetical protein